MREHSFTFEHGAYPLMGTLALPTGGGAHPAAVLCHGFGSYDDDIGGYTRLAGVLAEAGIASLRFSFSGSDPYPDKPLILPATRWVNDALAALAALRRVPQINGSRQGIVGMSMGGFVAMQAAVLDPRIAAVVALAPVSDGYQWLRARWLATRGEAAWKRFEKGVAAGASDATVPHFDVQAMPKAAVWASLLGRYPRLLREIPLASVADTFRARVEQVDRIAPRPLLIIHGDADESVPVAHSRALWARAKPVKQLDILPGAPHGLWDSPWESDVFARVRGWLSKHLKQQQES